MFPTTGGRHYYLFTLFDIPVYLSPWYLVVAVSLAWRLPALDGALLLACVTGSILLHEYGHGLMSRAFGIESRIILHGFGGLCAGNRAADTDAQETLILIAGPGIQLGFGAALFALGYLVPDLWIAGGVVFTALVWINLAWPVFNLLPIWPLDGGQLFRLLLLRWLSARTGERVAHGLSMAMAGGLAALAVTSGRAYMAVLVFVLFWENAVRWPHAGSGVTGALRSRRPPGRVQNALLAEAEKALAARDWAEAARLAHQARGEAQLAPANVRPETVQGLFEVLAVAASHQGEAEQALRYAERAPKGSARAAAARARALLALGRADDARQAIDRAALARLPEDERRDLERALA